MKWITARALMVYFGVLAVVLVISSVAEHFLDESAQDFFDIALLLAAILTVILLVTVVLPRRDRQMDSNRGKHAGQRSDHDGESGT